MDVSKLLNELTGAMSDRSKAPNRSAYGEVVGKAGGGLLVRVDGSSIATICRTSADAAVGERVEVSFRDHAATVTRAIRPAVAEDYSAQLDDLEEAISDLSDQQDADRETAEELASSAEPSINGSSAYRFEEDEFSLQVPGSATSIHGGSDRLELESRSIDLMANAITGLGAGFIVHTDQYKIGAINGGAYGGHTFTVPYDGLIVGVPNAYCDSKAIAVLGHRVDFESNTVCIDYRNVSESKNTANLGVIHIAVIIARPGETEEED